MRKSMFLVFGFLLFLIPLVSAGGQSGIYCGELYVDNVLQNDTSIPIEFYLGSVLKTTVYVNDPNITLLVDDYYYADLPKETNDSSTVSATVWGLTGYTGVWSTAANNTCSPNPTTINITRLANNAACEEDQACTSGICCANVCADICGAALGPTAQRRPSGGGGGGGSYYRQEEANETVPVVTPPVMPTTNPPAMPITAGSEGIGMDVSSLADGPEQTGGSQITGGAVVEGLAGTGQTAAIILGLLALGVGGYFLVRKWF
jgi:hypothetical protein